MQPAVECAVLRDDEGLGDARSVQRSPEVIDEVPTGVEV
jgi:hypothetical protein